MTRHADTFIREQILAVDPWPDLRLPQAQDGDVNAAEVFVDRPAAAHPERIALIAEDGCWTYAELAGEVSRTARVLVEELSVRPGQRVLLRGRNSAWFVVWLHAVLKAGAVVVFRIT